jgi:hypothetical protein
MNFRDIIDQVLGLAGQGSSGSFENLVKVSINSTYKRILDTGLIPHEHREFAFTTVASTSQYGMPIYVRSIKNIEDPDNDRALVVSNAREFDHAYAGRTDSGDPTQYYSLGARGVEKFPNSDGTISLVSDSSADDGSDFKIRITGFDDNGILVTEQITMDGTSSVTTANSYSATLGIERIVKEPASGKTFTGNVTVKDDDANTIAIIPVWWSSPDYIWLEFQPVPSSAITYTLRVEMRKPPLVNNGDWPEFDQEYHDLLVWGTTMDLLPSFGKSGVADRHRLTFDQRMKEFRGTKDTTPNAVWVFSNVQSGVGISNRPHKPLIPGVDIGLGTAT